MWRFASRSLRLCLFADDGTPLRGLLIAQSRGVRLSVHPKVTNFIALQKAKSISAHQSKAPHQHIKAKSTSAHQSKAPHQHIKAKRHISTSKQSATSTH